MVVPPARAGAFVSSVTAESGWRIAKLLIAGGGGITIKFEGVQCSPPAIDADLLRQTKELP